MLSAVHGSAPLTPYLYKKASVFIRKPMWALSASPSSPLRFFFPSRIFSSLRHLQYKLHSQVSMLKMLLRKEKLILSCFLDLYKNKERLTSAPGFPGRPFNPSLPLSPSRPWPIHQIKGLLRIVQLCRTHFCSERDKYLLGGHLGQGQVPFHPEVIQNIIQNTE